MRTTRPVRRLKCLLICGAIGYSAASTRAAPFLGAFTENFDSMGVGGTAPPAGWTMKTGNAGTSNSTWGASIPANGANSVASMVNAATPLTAASPPAVTNNNGYNAGLAGPSPDRALGTSPTTVSGGGIELLLTNGTGGALNSIDVSYDIRRFTAATTANELPGYQLFYSQDAGTSWTNVAALNPTIATVPNTIGVTSVPITSVGLGSSWADGTNLLLRWVDDNAQQTSPDQIIGLDNVSIGVPEPMSAAGSVLFGGLMALSRKRRAVCA